MSWDTAVPAGSDPISSGDDVIRTLKTDVQTALQAQGSFPGADAANPKYKWTPERGNTASRPSSNLVTGQLYLNSQTGTIQRYNGASWDDVTPLLLTSDVRAYRNSSNQSLSAGGDITVVFNAETRDVLSEFNTSTGIFTAANAGKYLIHVQVRVGDSIGNGGGIYVKLRIIKNSSTVAETMGYDEFSSSGVGVHTAKVTDIVDLAASDTVKIEVNPGSAGIAYATLGEAYTFITIKWLSA